MDNFLRLKNQWKTFFLCLALTHAGHSTDDEPKSDFKSRRALFEKDSSNSSYGHMPRNGKDQRKKTPTPPKSKDESSTSSSSSSTPAAKKSEGEQNPYASGGNAFAAAGGYAKGGDAYHGGTHHHKGNFTNVHAGGGIHQEFNEYHEHHYEAGLPSDDPLAFIDELHQQSENIRLNFESDPRIKDFKQTTLVIGPTGFGKSTFLTWLGSSTPLQAIRKGINIVLEGDKDQRLFIGHDKKTGTYYPTPVVFANPLARGKAALFCDCPGFGDVRGAHADIKNMIALSEVIRRTEAFNVLLVISGKSLEEKNSSILKLLNETAEMFFPSLEQYPMGALVFTKTQAGVDEGYIEELRQYEQSPENTLTSKAREWVRHCINHPDHHVLFMPAPSAVGPYPVSHRESWGKIQRLTQLQHPRFQPILSEDSKLYLSDLAASLNQQIAQKLADQRQILLDAFVNGLFLSLCEPSDTSQFRFKGSTRELLKYARAMKENFDPQERGASEKAKALLFLEKLGVKEQTFELEKYGIDDKGNIKKSIIKITLPGLAERSRQGLIEHVEHLDILRSLLGDVRNIRGRNIIIGYDYDQWLEGLQPMRIAINSLWESFQSPKKTEKKILKETFTASNQGTVREEEEFQLPIVHPWNGGTLTTLVDIMTFKSKKYDHKDEELRSIPIYKYILYRDGLDSVSDEVIEERGYDIPYDLTKFDVRVIPGSFNVQKKQVGLDIVKLYKRADHSDYVIKWKEDKNPAVSSKEKKYKLYTSFSARPSGTYHNFVRKAATNWKSYEMYDSSDDDKNFTVSYEHNDQELYSREIVPYYTIYEGKTLELEPQREGKVEYTPMIVDATVIPGSFNVQKKQVGLNVVRSYKRADRSTYKRELRVEDNPAVAGNIFYEHHDRELYSQEMVPYYTVYEGKTLDLEPQKKEERLPYRVKNTSSDVNRSSLRIRDGAVLDRTVAMTKTIEYERGDRSAYTAREEKNVNVEQTERIDEAKRKKYIDYIVQYERIRTVLSTKEEYYVSPERISNIKAQMEADSKLQSLFNQSQTLKRACMSHSGSISRDFENADRLNKKIEEIEKYAKERGYNYYEGYRDGIYYDEQSRRFRWH